MAASSMASLQGQELFEEQFACPVCEQPYDNDERQAKYLPCLHSYCKSCLQQCVIGGGIYPKFICPTPNCRTEVKLTDGTINSLPDNFVVKNLKEYKDIINMTVSCGNCEEGSQADSFCHDCDSFLCAGCIGNHHKVRSLRHHKLTDIVKLQQAKTIPKIQQRCKKHPEKLQDLYCKEANCRVPVCASCGLVNHRGHNLSELADVINEIETHIRQSSTNVATRIEVFTMERATLYTMQTTLTGNFNQKEKAMQRSVQELHRSIDSRYDTALVHLNHLYQTEMNLRTETDEHIDSLRAQMTNACEFANKACDLGQPAQLLTSGDQLKERLHALEMSQPPAHSHKTDFVLTAQHHSAISQMEDSLQQLCDVDWLINNPSEEDSTGNQQVQTDDTEITIERQLATLKRSYNNIEGKLNDVLVERTNQDEKLQQLHQEKESLEVLLSSANAEKTALEDTLQNLQKDVDEVKNSMKQRDEELGEKNEELEAVQTEKEQLNQQLETAQNQLKEQEQKIEGYMSDIEQQNALVDELTEKIASLETELDASQNDLQDVRNSEVDALQARKDVETELIKVREDLQGTVSQLQIALTENANLAIKLKEAMEATLTAENEIERRKQVNPSWCTIEIGQPNWYNATVQTVDFNGHLITTGGANVEAWHEGKQCSVRDDKNGKYTIMYYPMRGQLHVTVNGTTMKGSQFNRAY